MEENKEWKIVCDDFLKHSSTFWNWQITLNTNLSSHAITLKLTIYFSYSWHCRHLNSSIIKYFSWFVSTASIRKEFCYLNVRWKVLLKANKKFSISFLKRKTPTKIKLLFSGNVRGFFIPLWSMCVIY